MKVLIFDTYYPAFLAEHYAQRQGLEDEPYDAQLRSLHDRFFGTSNAYSHHLRELGHEAWEVIPNCDPLQQKWLEENGGGATAQRLAARVLGRARLQLQQTIARAQVEAHDPDVVYCQDLWFFAPDELRRMRSEGRLVVGQIASSAPGPEILREFSLVTTSFPHYVERFRALGVDTEYLQIGFFQRVLEHASADGPREHEVVFAGGLNPSVHPGGVALLEQLAGRLPLEVWGYGGDELPAESALRARWRGEAWGLDMYRVLGASRIVINRHIEAAEGFANNMRLFETTGMGALLVTEAAPNLGDLFARGSEVVTYESAADLAEKVEHYLGHEDERAAIAAAGHARTLRDHTYAKVVAALARMLEARLP